jgi:hypothetical protein
VLTCSETAAANSAGLAPESSLAQTYNERQDKPSFTQISFLNKSQQVETRKLINHQEQLLELKEYALYRKPTLGGAKFASARSTSSPTCSSLTYLKYFWSKLHKCSA